MPDQSPKPPRVPQSRAGHDGVVRGADQDARLAAELRRNLLRRKQQQRARADNTPTGETGDVAHDDEQSGANEG